MPVAAWLGVSELLGVTDGDGVPFALRVDEDDAVTAWLRDVETVGEAVGLGLTVPEEVGAVEPVALEVGVREVVCELLLPGEIAWLPVAAWEVVSEQLGDTVDEEVAYCVAVDT